MDYWDRKLSRPLALKDGTRVVTLRDAGRAIVIHFEGATRNDPLEFTIAALNKAAQTGKRADIKAATDSIARSLRWRAVLQDEATPSARPVKKRKR
jgi:hypothetical protein